VADPDDLLEKQFLESLGPGGRCVGDLKQLFGKERYDAIHRRLLDQDQIETVERQEIRDEIFKRDDVARRTALRKVGPAWFGRALWVTDRIAFTVTVIGTMAMAFFLFLAVDGLIVGDTTFSFEWADPALRAAVIAMIAGILATIYQVVLQEIAPDEGTHRSRPFKRVGDLFKRVRDLLLSLLFMVLAIPVIIIFVVCKMLGISALIKAPRYFRKGGYDERDELVVRRKRPAPMV
jgi:hypothetical protein